MSYNKCNSEKGEVILVKTCSTTKIIKLEEKKPERPCCKCCCCCFPCCCCEKKHEPRKDAQEEC